MGIVSDIAVIECFISGTSHAATFELPCDSAICHADALVRVGAEQEESEARRTEAAHQQAQLG